MIMQNNIFYLFCLGININIVDCLGNAATIVEEQFLAIIPVVVN